MEPSTDWARYAVHAERGVELLHAHYTTHVYGRHAHAGYAIGVTIEGVQAFTCRGAFHASSAGRIMAFNADDPHDGRAVSAEGFTYRMLYVAPETMRGVIADATDRPAAVPLFREPVIADAGLARSIALAHRALAEDAPALEQDVLLARSLLALALRHGSPIIRPARAPADHLAVSRARELLHADFRRNLSADELARIAGLSRFHLSRIFCRVHGMPPHDYLMQLRLAEAKRLLAKGEPPAEVAAAVGLVDQSHLNKRFRRAFGITPGQFQRATQRAAG